MAAARSRRADILEAAQREFGSAGFSGARIERIAALARVNKQLLFHYFQSKEGLFAAALAGLLELPESSGAGLSSPADELRSTLGGLEAAARKRPGLAAIAADARANEDFPRQALPLVRDWIGALRGRIESALTEGQRRGFFRDDIDPAAVADLALAAALGGAALDARHHAHPVSGLVLDYCAWR